jgi:hypothetical protein
MVPCMAQELRKPNLDAQRSAMKKLGFLIGRWAGEAQLLSGQGQPIILAQTEDAQYRLDGLILSIEGVGRTKADGKVSLQAFAIISYDDESGSYRLRAFNDGRFLECEVKLADEGNGIAWGFTLGQVRTNSKLRMTDQGDWTELTEISIGSGPPRKLMELTVGREK